MFTPDQLDILEAALVIAKQHDGWTFEETAQMDNLGAILERERLIGKQVTFLDNGREMTGQLMRLDNGPEGNTIAVIMVKDHFFTVDAVRGILGAAE